jgi:hypothetical protein
MARIIIIIFLFLGGCSTGQTKIDEVQVPILVCPMPPKVSRPELEIYKLSEKDLNDPGKVAQAIKVTLVQLQSYSIILETIIETYKNTSEGYDALRQELDLRFPEIKTSK